MIWVASFLYGGAVVTALAFLAWAWRPSGRQKSAQPGRVRDEVAEEAGVSHDTIAKAKFLDQHADSETKRFREVKERWR